MLNEDSEWLTRARVRRLEPQPGVRIYEIASPADWVELVTAHPLEVTASRGDAWTLCTAQKTTKWLLPDWRSVARDYDGIHLTTWGYLSTAGRALAGVDGLTVLAGWEPDRTFWLTHVLTFTNQDTLWAIDDLDRRWTQPTD